MIFPADQASKVAAGRKTMTRRLVRFQERKQGKTKNGSRYEYTTKPWRPRIGQREAVQPGPGRDAIGYVVVTGYRQEPLGEILTDIPAALLDVRQEGFKTRAEFADHWMRQHDPDWPPLEEELCPACEGHAAVDQSGRPDPEGGFPCLECELGVIFVPSTPDPDDTLERFRQRHADTLVWVIEFKPERDTPRLLSPADRPRGDDIGYTTSVAGAMPDEPEAVDEVTQARLTRQVREREIETAQQRRRREQDELEARVAEFCAEMGIPETDAQSRARVRAGIEAGIRRRNRSAA